MSARNPKKLPTKTIGVEMEIQSHQHGAATNVKEEEEGANDVYSVRIPVLIKEITFKDAKYVVLIMLLYY